MAAPCVRETELAGGYEDVIFHLDYPSIGDVDSRFGGVSHGHVEKVVVDARIIVKTVGGKCD